jgi:hypothetical protein
MGNIAYLAMDIHARSSTLGKMDSNGDFKGNKTFPTTETNIINALQAVKEKKKYLVMEEGTLTYWAAQVANPYVTVISHTVIA